MIVLGVTGGVGMGKSTCAQLLRARGIRVVDTDDLAREVVKPGQPALPEIRSAFGPQITDAEGNLRRGDLARLVFSDPLARKQLELILHPRIRELWRIQMESWHREGHRVASVVIPLLFEIKAEAELDASMCVACSEATQRERLAARGWSLEQSDQRNSAQWPIEQKLIKADFVIWTEDGLDLHGEQIDRILRSLVERGHTRSH